MKLRSTFLVASLVALSSIAARGAENPWSAVHGDWNLRIDGGGEIYFARLTLEAAVAQDAAASESNAQQSSPAVDAIYEADGRRGRVNSLSRDSGFYVVEVETRRSGMPARGLFAFELVDGRIVGDVDFESGSGARSYEFSGERLGPAANQASAAPEGDRAKDGLQAVADSIDASQQPMKRIVLRQGQAGYSAAVDTEIWAIAPSKPLDRQGTMTTDGNNGGGESQVLMQFGDLVGDGEQQVAAGHRVISATLKIVVFDPGTTVYLHRVLAPWGASSTWDGMAAGVSVDGVEASPVRDGFNFGQINMDRQEVQFDVSQTVQAWVDGEPNHGWVFINTGGNGWDFYSSDWIEEDLRPTLEVTSKPR